MELGWDTVGGALCLVFVLIGVIYLLKRDW